MTEAGNTGLRPIDWPGQTEWPFFLQFYNAVAIAGGNRRQTFHAANKNPTLATRNWPLQQATPTGHTRTFPVGEMQHKVAEFCYCFCFYKRTHSFYFTLVAQKSTRVAQVLESSLRPIGPNDPTPMSNKAP